MDPNIILTHHTIIKVNEHGKFVRNMKLMQILKEQFSIKKATRIKCYRLLFHFFTGLISQKNEEKKIVLAIRNDYMRNEYFILMRTIQKKGKKCHRHNKEVRHIWSHNLYARIRKANLYLSSHISSGTVAIPVKCANIKVRISFRQSTLKNKN